MVTRKIWTAAELELMSPNERAQLVKDGELASLGELDDDFRERVEAKSRRIVGEHGPLNTEPS